MTDTPAGRRKYRDYLEWLSASGEAAKRLGFDKMSRGWMKGTKDAKKAVSEDLKDEQSQRVVEAEASEMREPRWERGLQEALRILGRDREMLGACRKGEAWKVDLARYLREAYLTPYRWIAEQLRMGAPSYVQSLVSRQRREKESKEWRILKKHGKLDGAAYIDLNPVRANLVEDPKDYRFCGYAEAVAGNKQAREGLGAVWADHAGRAATCEHAPYKLALQAHRE